MSRSRRFSQAEHGLEDLVAGGTYVVTLVSDVPGSRRHHYTGAGRDAAITFIGHDLSNVTRRCLLRGVMDAVVAQDPGHEARSAMRVLLSLIRGEPILAEQERIRVEIVMRDNLP